MMRNTQNYWGFGLFPLSCILKTREYKVLETGSVSIGEWETPTLLGHYKELESPVIEVCSF
jgi:hypothetical protein